MRTIERLRPVFGLKRAARMLRISVSSFHRLNSAVVCVTSPFSLCRKRHPQQITQREENVIKEYAQKPAFIGWSLASLHLQILREGATAFSVTTLRKYVRVLRIERLRIRKPRYPIGIRANAPLKLLHMDATIFRAGDGSRTFLHLIIDNFSRAILGWRAAATCNSKDAMENLREVCEKHDLYERELQLLTDDGSENLGHVTAFLQRPGVFIKKLVGQVDITFSNSMIEAVNKILKYQFWYPKKSILHTSTDFIKSLETDIPRYNNRPQQALYGRTPREVLHGAIPDPRMFAEDLAAAKAERVLVNRQDLCGRC